MVQHMANEIEREFDVLQKNNKIIAKHHEIQEDKRTLRRIEYTTAGLVFAEENFERQADPAIEQNVLLMAISKMHS